MANRNRTHSSGAANLGVAIDIGTTTVVAHLTDMDTGARLATASGANAQRAYGADVISRIKYSIKKGHEGLTKLIRDQIASLISQACAASGERTCDIREISIAANTTMMHLAAGYSPAGMGAAPFAPASLFGFELPAWGGLPAAENAKVYYAPAVSPFVGGDVTAGMLAAGLQSAPGPALYLDIGTNGEIALKSGDRYYCCAAAAGPAFEGAEISMGMAAVGGAVSHVRWDGGLRLSVIGDQAPRGLCGSGLLDALAVLLETGAVDNSGKLLDPDRIGHGIAEHITKIEGKNAFELEKGGGVYVTAADVRKLQLAKAAIAAGIQTLLRHAGIGEAQVGALGLAGGFGSFLDKSGAARVGLFPKGLLPVAGALGNAAGEGAALALRSGPARAALEELRDSCECVDLAADPVFNEQFVEQMKFD